MITDDDSHDITLIVRESDVSLPSDEDLQNTRYCSTLVVRGNLPGVYQYSAGNRATDPMVKDSFTIEGIITMNKNNLCIYNRWVSCAIWGK